MLVAPVIPKRMTAQIEGDECVYNNMPPIGLGEATRLVPAAGRRATAAGRVGVREEEYPEGAPTEGIEV